MATESGRSSVALTNLNKMLDEEPFRVHFFQAVRLLQRMEPDAKPVGYFISPQDETIRFSALTTLSFPPSEIQDLKRREDGKLKMTVQFMGLCAAISVMPAAYTEHLIARARQKDHAMEEFLDMFNHRMISFFYRGWGKYRFYIEYERTREDPITLRMLDVLGLGTGDLHVRGGFEDEAYLNYAGLLARHSRSAAALQQLLQDYFDVPVKIQQFAGTWRKLEPENQTCFNGLGGANERLGVGVVAGDEVLDMHGRIRVSLGPMPLQQYLMFLPGQEAYKELAAWLRLYSNGSYETEVQLVLARADAPACELGSEGKAGPQLGLVSWLKTRPLTRDPADATYLVQ